MATHKTQGKTGRRGVSTFAALVALLGAGGLSYLAATNGADLFEAYLNDKASTALTAQGFDWASVETDGTQVHLQGIAPNEVARFRAITATEAAVPAGRVIDDTTVAASAEVKRPDFEVELLRNDEGISIIGLVPASLDREEVMAELKKGTDAPKISDLLETADYPVPDGWQDAFDFGLRAAELAERAKISIDAGRVRVVASVDSREAKAALEAALRRAKPANIALTTEVNAPRPVITPFTLRFVKDDKRARFDACSADTETTQDAILAAGQRAGVEGRPACQLGLGVPSADWGKAAVLAIDTVGALGGGSVTMSDTAIALKAPGSVESATFDEAVARLQAALPGVFSLTATLEQEGSEGPTEFSAVSDHGRVVLRGRIADTRMRDAVESYARSRFGEVDSALRLDPEVPGGWTLRAIAGLEAMAGLQEGTVTVTQNVIRITGTSGDQSASDLAARNLSDRLGAGANYELAIRYNRRLDPLLGLPSGTECVDGLNTIMRESLIGFEPNKGVIAGDPAPTIDALKAAIQDCTEYRIELGGHTDSQGSEQFNAELSRKRAQAVLEKMKEAGIDTRLMTVVGYGESQPIADNATEAGREANRRIEFRLLAEEPVASEVSAPPPTVTGVTEEAPPGELQGPELPPLQQPALTPAQVAAAETAAQIAETEALPAAPESLSGPEPGPQEELVAHATMVATIMVNDLATSPELAIDTVAELDGQEGEMPPDGAEPDADATPVEGAEVAPMVEPAPPEGEAELTEVAPAVPVSELSEEDRAAALTAAGAAILSILNQPNPAQIAATALGAGVMPGLGTTPRPPARPNP